jgi:DedD protein
MTKRLPQAPPACAAECAGGTPAPASRLRQPSRCAGACAQARAPRCRQASRTTQSRRPNGLPVSWSIQLASLSSRASAEKLQKTLRSQGYNAYPFADGKNRVFVGPLIERAEADRLRDLWTASRTSRVLWCVSSLSAAKRRARLDHRFD